MTAYSPAIVALHDMLKSQLQLTREFIEMQKHFNAERANNIQPRYHYTTLEDTKQVSQITFSLHSVNQDMQCTVCLGILDKYCPCQGLMFYLKV